MENINFRHEEVLIKECKENERKVGVLKKWMGRECHGDDESVTFIFSLMFAPLPNLCWLKEVNAL